MCDFQKQAEPVAFSAQFIFEPLAFRKVAINQIPAVCRTGRPHWNLYQRNRDVNSIVPSTDRLRNDDLALPTRHARVRLKFLQRIVERDESPERTAHCVFFAISENPRECRVDTLDFALLINEYDGIGNSRIYCV